MRFLVVGAIVAIVIITIGLSVIGSSQDMVQCDSSYPDVCIAPYPPDLDCEQIPYTNFRVIGSDKHGFDRDNDGIGCEK